MPTKARYLADLLNASGELDSTGAIENTRPNFKSVCNWYTYRYIIQL